MPRITISIPAVLKARLDHPRVRKSINISRVCQEALGREIRRLLDLPVDIERMEALLARLREEHERAGDHWFTMGTAAARDWVEHEASYSLVQKIGDAAPAERVRLLTGNLPRALSEQLARYRQADDFIESSFVEGFAHMIGILWETIKRNL